MNLDDSPLRDRMIFVVGARRSGTFWLQRILTAHPEVAAVPGETYLFSDGIVPLRSRLRDGLRDSPVVGTVYADREDVDRSLRDLCDKVFASFLDGKQMVAERTPFHALHLRPISAIYPDARVIHVIRDGREVTRSLLAQPWGPATAREAAGEWKRTIETARSAGLGPDRYLEVSYERLRADASGAISIFEWLGLRMDQDVRDAVEAESGVVRNHTPQAASRELTPDQLAEVRESAGDLLDGLGYGDDRTSAGPQPKPPADPVPSPPGYGPDTGERVHEVLDGLASLLCGRGDPGGILDPRVTIEVIAGSDSIKRVGSQADELLAALVTRDPAFGARQARSFTRPGLPWSAMLVGFELEGGEEMERAIFVRLDRGLAVEVAIHLLGAGSTLPELSQR